MLDLVIFVLAEAGEALRIERGPDLARAFVAVERGNRAVDPLGLATLCSGAAPSP